MGVNYSLTLWVKLSGQDQSLVKAPLAQSLGVERHRKNQVRFRSRMLQIVLMCQNRKGFKTVHFAAVFEGLDRSGYWLLIIYCGAGPGKIQFILQALGAELSLSCTLTKGLTAGCAEWFLN